MSRWRYLGKRLLMSIPVLWVGMTATFSIIFLGPIDPAARIAASQQQGNPGQAYQNARERLNLDEPVHEQYVEFMVDLLTLDLGQSWVIQPGVPAWDLILAYAPRTLWLGFWSVLIAIFVGVPLGFYAGLNSNTKWDYVASLGGIVWRAMPNFWLAIMLLALLSTTESWARIPPLGWAFDWQNWGPNIAMTGNPNLSNLHRPENFVAATKKIFPAALVLGSASMGNEMRIGRTAVLETKHEQYVDLARAKGVSDRALVGKHVFRNALIPLVPIITSEAFLLIGGSVLVETVFGINGMGKLFFDAAIAGDLPLVGSMMFVFIVLLLTINIVQDVLYTLIDPRVGYEGE